MFFENEQCAKLRFTKKGDTLSPPWREPTDADFEGMRLVTAEKYNTLCAEKRELHQRLREYADSLRDLAYKFHHEFPIGKPQPAPESDLVPQIEFGDTVRVVRATPNKAGEFFDSWERCIGLTGIWKPTEDENWDGQIECVLYMLSDLELINKAEKPTPHVWEVGQYAERPSYTNMGIGRVVEVREVNNYFPMLKFHDNFNICSSVCIPIPEPPMPPLPSGWSIDSDARLCFKNVTPYQELQVWIDFLKFANSSWVSDLNYMKDLDEWRKLTGRLV